MSKSREKSRKVHPLRSGNASWKDSSSESDGKAMLLPCVLAVLCLEIFQLSSCFKRQGVIKNWKTQRYMHSNYWLWCILLWYVVIVYVDSVAQANSTENSSTSNTSNGTSNGTSNSTQGTPGSVVSDGQLCLCNLSNLSSVSESQFFDVFWWDHVRILGRNGMKGIWWWYLRTWL